MAERKRVYRDEYGVRRTAIWDDEDPDRLIVHTEQVIDGLLEHTAAMREIPQRGSIKKIGTVPVEVWERAVNEGWAHDDKAWSLFFRDNPLLKTWEGNA